VSRVRGTAQKERNKGKKGYITRGRTFFDPQLEDAGKGKRKVSRGGAESKKGRTAALGGVATMVSKEKALKRGKAI